MQTETHSAGNTAKIGVKHFFFLGGMRTVAVKTFKNRGFRRFGENPFVKIDAPILKGLACSLTNRRLIMDFVYDDGGRSAAGFKGSADDCVCRSISIATGIPYTEVYDRLADGMATQRKSRHSRKSAGVRSARNGVNTGRKWFKDYMAELGFVWVPTMQIGQGCKTHLRADELSAGRLVVAVSKHYTAVIDGEIRDTHNPSRGGTRCVYGYWLLAG